MEVQVRLEQREVLGLQEVQGEQEQRELQVRLEVREHRACKEYKEFKGQLAQQVQKDRRGFKVFLVRQE